MTELPTVYGAPYSVYVRILLLALLEKGQRYNLEPVDIFAEPGPSETYLKRNPFGKIPSFSHNGFELFETSAIARYIDEQFSGPALMPDTPQERARVNQIISIVDNYAYPSMVWGIYVPLSEDAENDQNDENFRQSCVRAQQVIDFIERIADTKTGYLVGKQITLADIYLLPVQHYFMQTEPGIKMTGQSNAISAWWETNKSRPGVAAVLESR